MKNGKEIRYVSKFGTLDNKIYIGYWVGRQFHSEIFKASEKKQADAKYKLLKEQEEI
jgi:hypothetical protein